ncbi:hypothetical protein OF83DRAFT_1180220 [Amylostereum chailletii]|nr:hypothetical protein OF83DRAFT_1180220 [Amylostereum chailletii]
MPVVPADTAMQALIVSRRWCRRLRDKECYQCSNCGVWKRTTKLRVCSSCKSLKGLYCNKVCQDAHWSAHKPICLSIRAASHEGRTAIYLVKRAIVVPVILTNLQLIMIRELKLGTPNSISPSHALKVVCGLTSVDHDTNIHQLVDGGPSMAGEECCLTFLSFAIAPLDSIPATCYTQVCPPDDDIPVTVWFVIEELGDTGSSITSLLDLSFAVTWNVGAPSIEAIVEACRSVPSRPELDHLRLQVTFHLTGLKASITCPNVMDVCVEDVCIAKACVYPPWLFASPGLHFWVQKPIVQSPTHNSYFGLGQCLEQKLSTSNRTFQKSTTFSVSPSVERPAAHLLQHNLYMLTLDPVTAADKASSTLSILGSESSLRDRENQLMELFEYQTFDVITMYLKIREVVV